MFIASIVALILRIHLSFRRGNGNSQDGLVLSANGFGEILEKIVKLCSQAAFSVAADVIHQLIEQDEAGRPLGKKSSDDVTGRGSELFIVLCNSGKPIDAA